MTDSLATAIKIVAADDPADPDNLDYAGAVDLARAELDEAEVASWQTDQADVEQAYITVLRATDEEIAEALQKL